VRLTEPDKLAKTMKQSIRLGRDALGYNPQTPEELSLGLEDSISTALDNFFASSAFKIVLDEWRSAAMNNWLPFVERFQLENPGQINPSRLLSIKKFPLFWYVLDPAWSHELHQVPLPPWNWAGLSAAIAEGVQGFLDKRLTEFVDMLCALFCKLYPGPMNDNARFQQFEASLQEAMDTHVPAAFEALSSAVKHRVMEMLTADDAKDAHESQKQALCMRLAPLREAHGTDVTAIQNCISGMWTVVDEAQDDIYDEWVDCFKMNIVRRSRKAVAVAVRTIYQDNYTGRKAGLAKRVQYQDCVPRFALSVTRNAGAEDVLSGPWGPEVGKRLRQVQEKLGEIFEQLNQPPSPVQVLRLLTQHLARGRVRDQIGLVPNVASLQEMRHLTMEQGHSVFEYNLSNSSIMDAYRPGSPPDQSNALQLNMGELELSRQLHAVREILHRKLPEFVIMEADSITAHSSFFTVINHMRRCWDTTLTTVQRRVAWPT